MTDRNLSALVPWRRRIAGVAVLATLATVALYLSLTRRSSDMAAPAVSARIAPAGNGAPPAGLPRPDAAPRVTAPAVVVEAALLATPEAEAYFARERFNARVRAFFAEASLLAPAAREREVRELESAIDDYERSRVMSAGEAMTLRLGLVEALGGSTAERADRMAAIVARYESDGRQREARWAAEQAGDAAFARYKTREAIVVTEVMALQHIPGGLSRDAYLRQRLEAERVAAMSNPP